METLLLNWLATKCNMSAIITELYILCFRAGYLNIIVVKYIEFRGVVQHVQAMYYVLCFVHLCSH